MATARLQRIKADPVLYERHLAKKRAWQRNNRAKRLAHKAVENAIKNGGLVSRDCERCGAEKTHAHHDDYNKPLAVMWLCAKCHFHRHRELRAAGINIPVPEVVPAPSTGGLRNYTGGPRNYKRGWHKLDAEKVKAIRALYRAGVGPRPIARQFGVSRAMVAGIMNRKYWSHVVDDVAAAA